MAAADTDLTAAMAFDDLSEIDWYQVFDVGSRFILFTHLLYCLSAWLTSGQSRSHLPEDIPEVLSSLDGLFGELLAETDALTDEDSIAMRRLLASFRVELRMTKLGVSERRSSGKSPRDDEVLRRRARDEESATASGGGTAPDNYTEKLTAMNTYVNRMPTPTGARKLDNAKK